MQLLSFQIILILQHRKATLPDFLLALSLQGTVRVVSDEMTTGQVLAHLRDFLRIWKRNFVATQGLQLELRTKIPIMLWTEAVDLMTSSNAESRHNIDFYINGKQQDISGQKRITV
jgi:hypothetical protein